MGKIFPINRKVTVGGGGGGDGAPAGLWAEDATVSDAAAVGSVLVDEATVSVEFTTTAALTDGADVDESWQSLLDPVFADDSTVDDEIRAAGAFADDASVDDSLSLTHAALADDASIDDAFALIAAQLSDDVSVNDLVTAPVLSVDVARSGAPDNDPMFDTYINQAATGTNFGNSNILAKGKSTLANDELRAYVAIDLTWASEFTAINQLIAATTCFVFAFAVSNSNALVAATLTWTATYTATKPFTESTATWAAPPTIGTGASNGTISVAAGGAFIAKSFAIAAAAMQPVLGQWLLITFTGPTAAAPDTFNIRSRDNASSANRPSWSLGSLRRGT